MYAGASLALYIGYRVVAGKSDGSGSAYDPTGNGSNGATSPGYVFNAATVASKLKEAMRYTGTDEEAIINALAPVSQAQFGQVITAFKNTAYNPVTGNQYFLLWQTPTLYQLPFWLKSELSASRYNILRLKYPSYL